MKRINDLIKESYQIEISKGWQAPGETRPIPELIALIHSELSEALEEYRNGHNPREIYYDPSKPDKPEGVPIEIADVMIRVFGLCGQYGIDLEEAIEIKTNYNKTRPVRHGGKLI
jgi:NTP pyrophosphatase (non-canonical NTP hydrolase)